MSTATSPLARMHKVVYQSHIRCGRESIGYLECPLDHKDNQVPHLRLDEIDTDTEFICSKSGEAAPSHQYDFISYCKLM